MEGKLFIYSGPSGVGKGTLLKPLLKQGKLELSVSVTTRKPRPGEVNGREYYFITEKMFKEYLKKGEILEYTHYGDHYYGTPKTALERKLKQGISVVLEIDIAGFKQVKELMPQSETIFVMPPSVEELKSRLINRNTETEAEIAKRLSAVEKEIEMSKFYDYIIVNDDIKKATKELEKIIFKEV